MDYLILLIAFIMLIKGADYTVISGEKLAFKLKVQPFVIGALAVGLGTSLPEIVSGIVSSVKHQNDFIISNVIGSLMFNISFILGITLILTKRTLTVKRDIFYKDITWLFAPLLIFLIMVYKDGVVDRVDGAILIFIMIAFIYSLYNSKNLENNQSIVSFQNVNLVKSILLLIFGFIILIIGANLTIEASSDIAESLGISKWIIGIFVIGFGTSLPELAVSISGLRKGNGDLVVGNIIGSNVANISFVIGIPALIHPVTLDVYKNINDILYSLLASLIFFTIIVNKLYNKSGGILLLIVFILFVKSTIFLLLH